MALFNFKKKMEDDMYCSCCGCATNAPVDEEIEQGCETSGKTSVKILGSGCKNCHALFDNAKQAVNDLGLDADVQYVTDMQIIAKYGVMSMPAVVINEKVVSAGKVLSPSEIEKLLKA